MFRKKFKILLLLYALLVLYSISGVFSKIAAGQPFMSASFFICYAAMLLLLGIYAIGWQQVIKHLSLTAAYANRAVTVVLGMVWGVLFFNEPVTAGKAAGVFLVITGIMIYAGADGEK